MCAQRRDTQQQSTEHRVLDASTLPLNRASSPGARGRAGRSKRRLRSGQVFVWGVGAPAGRSTVSRLRMVDVGVGTGCQRVVKALRVSRRVAAGEGEGAGQPLLRDRRRAPVHGAPGRVAIRGLGEDVVPLVVFPPGSVWAEHHAKRFLCLPSGFVATGGGDETVTLTREEGVALIPPLTAASSPRQPHAASSSLFERRSPAWWRSASSLAICGLWLKVTKPYGVVTLVRCGRDRAALLAGSRQCWASARDPLRAKGSETLRSALRSDATPPKPEDEVDEGDKDDSGSAPELPKPSSESASSSSSSSGSLSSDLKLLCTDRVGMVNCGMLSGVRIFG
ncbi:hypothetical protein EYF80_014795 [Liparis tanakae]|uniref:Uncharacterized protein n=1 Tax=Liparis tanakae TaxID=230148 RepID=A0A4Z2IAF0_9TELE|nr:hypothetical protein EYF80_014795 [Liparis tanakae]